MIQNTHQNFGLVTRIIHWVSAITIIGLFGLGYWMVDLDYYSQWYQTAPHWHESIGVLLCLVTLFRLFWRAVQIQPQALTSHSKQDQFKAKTVHVLLYILLFVIFSCGYLIPTADGRAIEVFTWFSLPAFGELFNNQEDIAGSIHEYGAYILIGLALIHALAAIKHHFIDKDATLKRMLYTVDNNSNENNNQS